MPAQKKTQTNKSQTNKPQTKRVASTANGASQAKKVNAAQPRQGNAAQPRQGNAAQPRQGNAAQPRQGNAAQSRQGNAAQSRQGNAKPRPPTELDEIWGKVTDEEREKSRKCKEKRRDEILMQECAKNPGCYLRQACGEHKGVKTLGSEHWPLDKLDESTWNKIKDNYHQEKDGMSKGRRKDAFKQTMRCMNKEIHKKNDSAYESCTPDKIRDALKEFWKKKEKEWQEKNAAAAKQQQANKGANTKKPTNKGSNGKIFSLLSPK